MEVFARCSFGHNLTLDHWLNSGVLGQVVKLLEECVRVSTHWDHPTDIREQVYKNKNFKLYAFYIIHVHTLIITKAVSKERGLAISIVLS